MLLLLLFKFPYQNIKIINVFTSSPRVRHYTWLYRNVQVVIVSSRHDNNELSKMERICYVVIIFTYLTSLIYRFFFIIFYKDANV